MGEPTLQAQVDAANAYEALFVPALFGQWAPIVADAAQIQRGQRVLDVACGTGILACEIATRTGSATSVVGVDPGPGMVAVAKQLAPAIEWREGVAESLPFADQSFDAVVSQFGLMCFTDRPQALREMRRVLAPGGRLAVAVWDSLDNMPAYASEVALLETSRSTYRRISLPRRSLSMLRGEQAYESPWNGGCGGGAVDSRLGSRGSVSSIRSERSAHVRHRAKG